LELGDAAVTYAPTGSASSGPVFGLAAKSGTPIVIGQKGLYSFIIQGHSASSQGQCASMVLGGYKPGWNYGNRYLEVKVRGSHRGGYNCAHRNYNFATCERLAYEHVTIFFGDYISMIKHDGTESQRAREPESQRAREPESQRAREPEGQRAREPESQRAREPESQRSREAEGQRAREPESQRATGRAEMLSSSGMRAISFSV
jgi:hypothetical protein